MHSFKIPFWKTAPFIRLLFPLITGIIIQYYFPFNLSFLLIGLICYSVAVFLFHFVSLRVRYYTYKLQGILIQVVIVMLAMLLTYNIDARNDPCWYGDVYTKEAKLLVRLSEPLSVRAKSFKAEASVEAIILKDTSILTRGHVALYFAWDPVIPVIGYGNTLLINTPLQAIKNSGNPGAFDYERYAKLQGIFHSAFLKAGDYAITSRTAPLSINHYLFPARDFVLNTLRNSLPQDNTIAGLAEALLIGYKGDLDKDLLQAYSNTGVVHIIAISGLHLGLIYAMLTWIFNVLPYIRKSKTTKVVLILAFLWAFSLITGASASVLRSAVMFTCIVIGKNYFGSGSIYNSLTSSAFLLLCYNPFFLWDVGFQLSYTAIYGIVWLQQPIYRLFYLRNKWLNKLWQMTSVTLAAQITTFPVCIYYFHQFPNMFLVTNLTAVPLSTLILFVEIIVVMLAWWPTAAHLFGNLCYGLIWLMNKIISYCNEFPYSRIDAIHATLYTTFFLYALVLGSVAWLLHRSKSFKVLAMAGGFAYIALFIINRLQRHDQAKMVVYNIPHKQAIDFITQDKFLFMGDSSLQKNDGAGTYYLKPSRTALQVSQPVKAIRDLSFRERYLQFHDKTIMIIDSTVHFYASHERLKIDILIISGNPKLEIENITKAIAPRIVVFDASNSLWKIAIWKKQCEQLLLPGFSVPENGAFVVDIQ